MKRITEDPTRVNGEPETELETAAYHLAMSLRDTDLQEHIWRLAYKQSPDSSVEVMGINESVHPAIAVTNAVVRYQADIVLNGFKGRSVLPTDLDGWNRLMAYREAGGDIDDHPDSEPTINVIGFGEDQLINIAVTESGDVHFVSSPGTHPLNAFLRAALAAAPYAAVEGIQ